MMDATTLLLVLMMGALPAQGLGASDLPSTPRIDYRHASQQQRINDGGLTRSERRRIEDMQDQASANISSQTHDRQRAH